MGTNMTLVPVLWSQGQASLICRASSRRTVEMLIWYK